jgi:RNA polymerase sigma-70 factor (ECF subfamily)
VNVTNAEMAAVPEDDASLESVFITHYARVARTIALVIGDHGRAEELAVEIFLRWSRMGASNAPNPDGWLYRAAANLAVDELRRRARRSKLNQLFRRFQSPATPEEIHGANQERDRVRQILREMQPRQAELLVLRTQGFSYEELASALNLNPASVGKLLSRARQTFREEYISRYGQHA